NGLGLGLSICEEIVERHGGKLGVVSEGMGKGSLFYFTLPLDLEKPQEKSLEDPVWFRPSSLAVAISCFMFLLMVGQMGMGRGFKTSLESSSLPVEASLEPSSDGVQKVNIVEVPVNLRDAVYEEKARPEKFGQGFLLGIALSLTLMGFLFRRRLFSKL
ncbi:MAG: hypothetical protein HY399_06115, partial [Elusimicrobia bacterium]|nr:hypothetical protein [Elusimicrobiota bacterium]